MPITPIEMMQNLAQMENVAKEAVKIQGIAEREQNQQAHILEKTSRMVQEKLQEIDQLTDNQRIREKNEEENHQKRDENAKQYSKSSKKSSAQTTLTKSKYDYGEDPYKGKIIDIKE